MVSKGTVKQLPDNKYSPTDVKNKKAEFPTAPVTTGRYLAKLPPYRYLAPSYRTRFLVYFLYVLLNTLGLTLAWVTPRDWKLFTFDWRYPIIVLINIWLWYVCQRRNPAEENLSCVGRYRMSTSHGLNTYGCPAEIDGYPIRFGLCLQVVPFCHFYYSHWTTPHPRIFSVVALTCLYHSF